MRAPLALPRFSNQVKQIGNKHNDITAVHYIYLCIIYNFYDLIHWKDDLSRGGYGIDVFIMVPF